MQQSDRDDMELVRKTQRRRREEEDEEVNRDTVAEEIAAERELESMTRRPVTARTSQAAAQLASMSDTPMMEAISPAETTTRMASRGRGNSLKDKTPAEIARLKELRTKAQAQKREEKKLRQAIGVEKRRAKFLDKKALTLQGGGDVEMEGGDEEEVVSEKPTRHSKYWEAIPSKVRPPGPAIPEVPGREVVVITRKRSIPVGPPVGMAQRIRYKIAKKIEGLSSEAWRLETAPTQRELNTMVYSPALKKKITLRESRHNQVMREAGNLKADLTADGFAAWLMVLPRTPHYKKLPMSVITGNWLDNVVVAKLTHDERTGVSDQYVGNSTRGYRYAK